MSSSDSEEVFQDLSMEEVNQMFEQAQARQQRVYIDKGLMEVEWKLLHTQQSINCKQIQQRVKRSERRERFYDTLISQEEYKLIRKKRRQRRQRSEEADNIFLPQRDEDILKNSDHQRDHTQIQKDFMEVSRQGFLTQDQRSRIDFQLNLNSQQHINSNIPQMNLQKKVEFNCANPSHSQGFFSQPHNILSSSHPNTLNLSSAKPGDATISQALSNLTTQNIVQEESKAASSVSFIIQDNNILIQSSAMPQRPQRRGVEDNKVDKNLISQGFDKVTELDSPVSQTQTFQRNDASREQKLNQANDLLLKDASQVVGMASRFQSNYGNLHKVGVSTKALKRKPLQSQVKPDQTNGFLPSLNQQKSQNKQPFNSPNFTENHKFLKQNQPTVSISKPEKFKTMILKVPQTSQNLKAPQNQNDSQISYGVSDINFNQVQNSRNSLSQNNLAQLKLPKIKTTVQTNALRPSDQAYKRHIENFRRNSDFKRSSPNFAAVGNSNPSAIKSYLENHLDSEENLKIGSNFQNKVLSGSQIKGGDFMLMDIESKILKGHLHPLNKSTSQRLKNFPSIAKDASATKSKNSSKTLKKGFVQINNQGNRGRNNISQTRKLNDDQLKLISDQPYHVQNQKSSQQQFKLKHMKDSRLQRFV